MSDHELIRLTGQLLEVLESDVRYIKQVIAALNQLRRLLIKHDLPGLEQMLNDIRAMADTHTLRDLTREQLREGLASLLGCQRQEVTVSRLAAAIPQPWHGRLLQIRSILRQLTDQLAQEHRSTAILLADCARFNRMLLASLLQDDSWSHSSYPSTSGKAKACQGNLMNVRF